MGRILDILEVLPLSVSLKTSKFNLFQSLCLPDFKFRDNDILVISSKYVSMSEGSIRKLDSVKNVSRRAVDLAAKYHMNAKLVELVIRESDFVFKGIPGFLLAIRDGIIAPNAGIDKSNVSSGFVILYPRQPFKTAENLRRKFLLNLGIKVMIIIADSRLMPTRIGTTGIAISCAGFEPIEDQRGKNDLFGNILKVTLKAVADSLATIGVLAMGESNELIPAVVIRNIKVIATNRKLSWHDMAVDATEDIYMRAVQYQN
ncbi:MAG TPA: coenzyme F420-0:L-glutamate ligase [Nitrososphaeraceae archaeon]|nr:coenzyme F420-0:L-glutamate ligase [Nitrososphaeraceae archaeon]